mmetsp:Transcript_1196/g.2419  ORF Transcript_1196/g.2419 Transcript_1196/m.2419 type:complete len:275 (+) Transcript_1196:299-1123(+)
MNQSEQSTTDSVQQLSRHKILVPGIFEKNNESASNGQTGNSDQEERFSAPSLFCVFTSHVGDNSHGELCCHNSTSGQGNGETRYAFLFFFALSHEFTEDQQDVGICKMEEKPCRTKDNSLEIGQDFPIGSHLGSTFGGRSRWCQWCFFPRNYIFLRIFTARASYFGTSTVGIIQGGCMGRLQSPPPQWISLWKIRDKDNGNQSRSSNYQKAIFHVRITNDGHNTGQHGCPYATHVAPVHVTGHNLIELCRSKACQGQRGQTRINEGTGEAFDNF